MRILQVPLCLWLSLLASGCGSTIAESFRRRGLDRAAFELQCPPEQVELTGLGTPLDSKAKRGSQVGVSGCGRRLVYVFMERSGWILNSDSQRETP